MHLVLPYAGTASPSAAARVPPLPGLARLLARWEVCARDDGDEHDLSPPHERALARLQGWPLADGLLPLAASSAQRDGLAPAPGSGWGLLSPTHWHLGTEQVSLTDPAQLALDDAGSRALFAAVQPLFEDDGWRLVWGAATRWYAQHDSLTRLPSASLDRVVGRNVDLWLTPHPEARRIRRLQAEVQMLLYTHPANDAREAAGLLPVNSFWLSGTGATPAGLGEAASPAWRLDDRLRAPALADDGPAWAQAWSALDAGPIQQLLAEAEAGRPACLTLCGERHALSLAPRPRPWYRRGPLAPRATPPAALLATL